MLLIDMKMPKRCKGCLFSEWSASLKRLCCTFLHKPIAKYCRAGEARAYEFVYLRGADEKRRPDCPLQEQVLCYHCKHYEGNHTVPGCAPCSLRGLGEVMWDDFCKRGERWDKNGNNKV